MAKISHTIRSPKGEHVTVDLSRTLAIRVMCTECMGWEGSPKECASMLCPLFPWRGKSLLAWGNKPSAEDEAEEVEENK